MSRTPNDDDGRLAARYTRPIAYGRKKYAVTFGAKPLLIGTAVTHLQLAALVGALFGEGHPYSVFMMFLLGCLFGLPIAALGCFMALALGLALRTVANQGIHVLVFLAAFTFIPAAVLLWAGLGIAALTIGLIIGTAAAVGRTSVCSLVTVHARHLKTPAHPAE